MELIKILDSNQQVIKYIGNAIPPLVHVSMLGEFTFSFQCTLEYMEYIHYRNYVLVDDEVFKIQKYKTYRTQDNQKLINVYCEQASYKLINPPYMDNFNYVQGQATQPIDLSQSLNILLEGTGFTFNIDSTSSKLFAIKRQCSKRRVLMSLAKAWGKEIKFHKFDITLKDKIGADNGVQYRVGKNIIGISKEVDDTQWDEFGNPLISYEIEAIDQSAQYAFEKVDIGDTVKAIDSELKINLKTRVLEKEYNPITKKVARVVISNRIPDLTDYQLELEEKAEQNSNDIKDTQNQLDQTTEDLQSQIEETGQALSLDIQKTNSSLYIIAEDFSDKYNQQQAQISIMPFEIKTSVRQELVEPLTNRVISNESSITQQANQIQMLVSRDYEVNGLIMEMHSSITQQANQISLVVDAGGRINGASIIAGINESNSYVKISADKIRMEGLLMFENIRGDAIRFNTGGYVNAANGGLRFGYGNSYVATFGESVMFYYPGGSASLSSAGLVVNGVSK